jgi:hypothetical protein
MMSYQPLDALAIPSLTGSLGPAMGMIGQPVKSSHPLGRRLEASEHPVRGWQEAVAEDVHAAVNHIDIAFPAGLADIVKQTCGERVALGPMGFQETIDTQEMPLISAGEDMELDLHGLCHPSPGLWRKEWGLQTIGAGVIDNLTSPIERFH